MSCIVATASQQQQQQQHEEMSTTAIDGPTTSFAAPTTPVFATPAQNNGLVSPMVLTASKDMALTSKILNDYFSMMRVQLISDTKPSPTFMLETPNPKIMFPPIDLPTTAELMQRCLAVNPFEAKFREANQKISCGAAPSTSGAHQSIEALESNGLMPFGALSSNQNVTDLLLKIPQSQLQQQSPGIFGILAGNNEHNDNGGTRCENLKTADISKLLSVVSQNDSTGQAPRTADVLNAVLDMHSDRLHTINYLNNKPDFSALLRSPSSSAPNSASILGASIAVPSTSNGLLAPNSKPINAYSPIGSQTNLSSADSMQRSPANNGLDWDLKPIKKEMPYYNDEMMGNNRTYSLSSGSDREMTPLSTSGPNPVGRPPNTPGRGRGRGRSTTADMAPDDRRNTILERNKAAAVRYRKRKKEEHDDMMGRVHNLESEKNSYATQNQVLRREVDRLTALLQDREQRCVCLKGMNDQEHQSSLDLINSARNNGMYQSNDAQLMLNGLNGIHLKRPKM